MFVVGNDEPSEFTIEAFTRINAVELFGVRSVKLVGALHRTLSKTEIEPLFAPEPVPVLVSIVTFAQFKQFARSVLLMLMGFVAPGVKLPPAQGEIPVQVVVNVPPVVAAALIVTSGGSR